jgi:hypothetical protein
VMRSACDVRCAFGSGERSQTAQSARMRDGGPSALRCSIRCRAVHCRAYRVASAAVRREVISVGCRLRY